jgi:hypothetical protein
MQHQLHFTPAIAAITFVLCLAGFAFVVLVLLPSPFAQPLVTLKSVEIAHGAAHLGKSAVYVVLAGYAAGIVGWLATFGLRCDGMHRLASVLEHSRYK